jgi:Flp pilus assembly protein TadG
MKTSARLRILCKANHGAALVELALVIPILLLLVLGAVDYGRAYYIGLEVTNAAHAGAEYGSLNPADTTGMSTAANKSAPNLSNLKVTPTYGCECSDGTSPIPLCSSKPTTCSGNVVNWATVKISTSYALLMPWPGISSPITLSGTATVRGN